MTARHPSVAPLVLALLAALSATPNAAAPPPPELLACHDAAVGGEPLRAAERIQYRLEIVEPEFTVEGVYRAERSGRARIDIHADGIRVFSEGWDGERAWQLGRDAAEPTFVEGEPAAALRHGVERPGHLWTLADMTAQGHRLEHVGRESVDGVAHHVLRLTLADGFETWYLVHPDTCRIERSRDFRAFHPDLDPERTWVETVYDDFRTVDGVTRAFRSRNVDLETGEVLGTTTVLEVELDPQWPAGVMEAGYRPDGS